MLHTFDRRQYIVLHSANRANAEYNSALKCIRQRRRSLEYQPSARAPDQLYKRVERNTEAFVLVYFVISKNCIAFQRQDSRLQ